MSRFWNPAVHGLKPYQPGEQPRLERLIKLNTNENPDPPSPRVVAAIRAALGEEGTCLARYPDPEGERLKTAIRDFYAPLVGSALSSRHIFVGNSSDEVLAIVFQALLKHEAPLLLPDITYSFYTVYCGLYGIAYATVPLDAAFAIQPEDYAGRGCGGIIFANPNAPTGVALPLSGIRAILEAQPDVVVVVDEAYVDFGADSAIALLEEFPNLLVVQTLSKSRALAGLRVGFAIGAPELIEGMERVKNCFNSYVLDHLAIAGGAAALEDRDWFRENCARIIAERERLTASLADLGFVVLPSAANFVFARHPAHPAGELAQKLRERSIIVRHFDAPRIEDYLRITVGTPDECAALITALAEILPTGDTP
ncbi:MAG: histidinol-phosphate transaminase [Zoogloeaceae bacterium]|jgi:histidinol-phosphate aminotransferase|nr:histidinol-phosphate transaminase [Zoogloeaceae bacterium]